MNPWKEGVARGSNSVAIDIPQLHKRGHDLVGLCNNPQNRFTLHKGTAFGGQIYSDIYSDVYRRFYDLTLSVPIAGFRVTVAESRQGTKRSARADSA
jgi:hypothetical protein